MKPLITHPVLFTKEYYDYTVVAISAHENQRYGQFPYSYHLAQVDNILAEAGYTENSYRAAAWLHDVVEDTKLTVGDLANLFSIEIATLVWACTGVGLTRDERNQTIFRRLKERPQAAPVKCADRLANMAYGIAEGNLTKLKMYLDEWPKFKENVGPLMTNSKDKRAHLLFCDLEDWVEKARTFYDLSIKKREQKSEQPQ